MSGSDLRKFMNILNESTIHENADIFAHYPSGIDVDEYARMVIDKEFGFDRTKHNEYMKFEGDYAIFFQLKGVVSARLYLVDISAPTKILDILNFGVGLFGDELVITKKIDATIRKKISEWETKFL